MGQNLFANPPVWSIFGAVEGFELIQPQVQLELQELQHADDAIAFCTNVVSDFVKFSTASPTKARMPMDNLIFFMSLKSLIVNDYIISNALVFSIIKYLGLRFVSVYIFPIYSPMIPMDSSTTPHNSHSEINSEGHP